MEFYKKGDNKLFCIDQERYRDIMEIWGTEADIDLYRRFEFILTPCNYVHREIEKTDDYVAEECIADHKA